MSVPAPIHHRRVTVDGLSLFYREAGPADAPVVLLMHGFPTSSFMFRDLIPLLSGRYRVIAPDMPGFGHSDVPERGAFQYGFDRLAEVMDGFTRTLGLTRYALYIFDYGAPVGLRLARMHPERVTAIVTQNGNAYEEGLSDGWGPLRAYWQEPTEANRNLLRIVLTPEITRFQYLEGVPDQSRVSPDGYTLDQMLLDRPGVDEIQLDLLGDYKSNLAAYPGFHAYFRKHRPPLLAVWGRNDPYFIPVGAQAYARDIPDAEIHLLDTGHFALETHAAEIGALMLDFLDRRVAAAKLDRRVAVAK